MDPNTIREAFQHYVLIGCGIGLLTMTVGGIVYGLARMPGRIGRGVRKYGWGAVALFFGAAAWATMNAYPTQEDKDEYEQEQQRQMATERAWGEALGIGGVSPATHSLVSDDSDSSETPGASDPVAEDVPDTDVADGGSSESASDEIPTIRLPATSDYEVGLVLTGIGTGETHDFATPLSAESCEDWRRFGANRDWFRTVFTNGWGFAFGTNRIDALTVFSYGTARPKTRDKTSFFSPLESNIGISPASNWHTLTNGIESLYWQCLTPSNTFVMTWRNVLLDRLSDRPVSFQMEFEESGGLTFRYDLSALPDEIVSNLVVGVSNGGFARTFTKLDRNTTSLHWSRLTLDDLANPDRDGDGVPTVDELFVHHTNPDLADTDGDGRSDGDEVVLGLNPLSRDSDGDGIVDGSDPDPLVATDGLDEDGNGLPDAYEDHWFGVSNHLSSASVTNLDETGFAPLSKYLAGMDPTNAASAAVTVVTNQLTAWRLWDSFAMANPHGPDALVYERTFRIGRTHPWQQFFLSSSPDSAGWWELRGAEIEWVDSNGTNGTVSAAHVGDSYRIPLSDWAETLTIRLRAHAPEIRSRCPVYLLSYSPEMKFDGGRIVELEGGGRVCVYVKNPEQAISMRIDRTHRPSRSPLSEDEADDSDLQDLGMATMGEIEYSGDATGGEFHVYRPGVYPMPVPTPGRSARPRRMAARSGRGGGGGLDLLVLDPSVWYGEDHCTPGWGCDYDWDYDWYYVEQPYPLDSKCLRRGWHHDHGGGWECNCEPGVSTGLGDGGPSYLSSEFSVDGDRCSGSVKVGDEIVWSGSAVHTRETDCGGGEEFTGEEPFDDGCDSCTEGCRDGNCDALETPTLGSLKFRIPLGTPRKGQISGFIYFDTSVPMTVSPSTFLLLARDDARVRETGSFGTRRIVCTDERGRDISIEGIQNGVRVTILTTSSQALEHRWEITNVDGDDSRIRLRKISSQTNVMEDWTFTYSQGDWTRFDNISQIREELVREDDLNGESRSLWESRTKYDANDNFLGSIESRRSLIGSCDNAVVRETWRREGSGLNYRWQSAEYWDDPQSGRHGRVRLLTSNYRAWEYSDYDSFGRVTVRIRQRGTSEAPAFFPVAVSNELSDCSMLTDAFVTVYGYETHEGDNGTSEDFRSPRTVSEFVVTDGAATLVSRRWHRHSRNPRGGIASVRRETWRAVSQTSAWGDDGLPYSYETTLDANAPGVPLVARGDTVESLDENGVLAETEVSVVEGRIVEATRRSRNGVPFDTYRVVEKDDVHGNVLRRAELMADDDTVISDEQSIYDSQNRLRATAFLDGTSLTNHYSCCRLLWARDRENRRTLRSARTGEDHLYWATEDVWLQELSTNGLYRVTQHFFDALGRETNTVVYAGTTPGEANDWTASEGKAYSSAATQYPFGGSDYAVVTDVSGKVTERRTDLFDECVETGETILTNGIVVTRTKTRSFFDGRTTSRREWEGNGWAEESRFSEYAADGSRIDYAVTESHDCGIVTNSVTVYDLLGRTVSQTVPGANGAWIETRSFYDGASGRLVRTEVDGSPDVTYGYDARGERIATAQNDIVNRVVTSYETVGGEVWRVRTSTRIAPGADDVVSTERVQLTGLSDALRSRRVSVSASGKVTRTESSFDAAGNAVSTIVSVDGVETESNRSSCGLLLSASTIDGGECRAYDAFGRVATVSSFAVGADAPRARQAFVYDVSGNVVATDSDYGAEGTAASYSVFDVLGREVSATDLSARTVETGYDGLGRTVSVGGDTHPLMSGYDSAGRKTQGLTTRDGGGTWDATTWTFDPRSGLNTAKRYADGSQITYAYTDNGRKTRTTWARGVWKENAYDAANRISGVTYSDGTPGVAYSYTGAGKVSEAAVADGAQTAYGYDARLLCTNESVSVGEDCVDVVRTYDDRSRCDFLAVEVTNVAHAVKTRRFDAYGRVVGYGITNACGRGMAATLQYTGSRVDGIAYTLPNGGTFTSSFTRSPSRPDLVTRRDYRLGAGSIYSYETGYDLAGRPTNAVDSVSQARAYLYNRRNELAEALVGTNAFGYAYDSIGNRTSDMLNGMSRSYAANCLNQYAQVDAAQMVYDADGNLIQDDRFAYAYDAENRMLSARPTAPSEGDLAVVNAYDHKHRRIMKRVERFDGEEWQTSETHAFAYDGCNIALERIAFADGTTRMVEYFWGNDLSGTEQGAGGVGGLVAVSVDGAFFVPCYDHNGNIVCYVSESGTIAAQYVYDPYGNVIEQYGTLVGKFAIRFSTKYTDVETGLISYLRRFYRPDHGRWLNRDPIEERGGENLYAFCVNNCIVLYDVNGESFEDVSNFMAGVADAMTFGLTSLARKGINSAMYGDWDDPADVNSSSYIAGEVTEVVVEIAVTAGGATLRHVAKKTVRAGVEGGARQAFRRAKGIGKGGVVHHVNPIKGHYNGKKARFPLPFEWAAQGEWNMVWYATKAEHIAAHQRLMQLEALDKLRTMTMFSRQGANAIMQHLNSSSETKCWDSIDIDIMLNHEEQGFDTSTIGIGASAWFEEYGRSE